MGYKVTFMDNEVYSAQDINEHFSKLFSGGVSLLESGNILADLNSMTSDITSYGVLYDSCLVVKKNNGYRISAGTAFMHDGSSITFDKDGYDFTAELGKYWYVYLKRNEPENRIDIVVTETEPSGEYVPLAHIDYLGAAYDRRRYAQLKINTIQANTLNKFDLSYYLDENHICEPFDVGYGNFSYIVLFDVIYKVGTASYTGLISGKNLVEIADGEKIVFSLKASNGTAMGSVEVTKNGQYLETKVNDGSGMYDYELHFAVI